MESAGRAPEGRCLGFFMNRCFNADVLNTEINPPTCGTGNRLPLGSRPARPRGTMSAGRDRRCFYPRAGQLPSALLTPDRRAPSYDNPATPGLNSAATMNHPSVANRRRREIPDPPSPAGRSQVPRGAAGLWRGVPAPREGTSPQPAARAQRPQPPARPRPPARQTPGVTQTL